MLTPKDMLSLAAILTISICVAYLYGFFWLGQHMKEDEHKIEKDILKESERNIAEKYYHAHFNPYPWNVDEKSANTLEFLSYFKVADRD